MSLCNNAASWIYETIISNLATTHRKQKNYKEAIKYYLKAIHLNPMNANTYFALAFTYHITNQLE
jgi:anaphase-promoting complex subunit 6